MPLSPIGRPEPPPVGSAAKKAQSRKRSTPVRIMQGFFANLPPAGVQFFDRTFEQPFPNPLQPLAGSSWQKSYPLWRYKIPPQRALVIRNMQWTPYRNDNIGVGQPIAIPPGSVATSLGFQLLIGGRWKLDINNNLQGAGSPNLTVAGGGNVGIAFQEASVPSGMDPDGGSFSDRYGNQGGFVLYARPGELLESKFFAFAIPPVQILKVQFRINGWVVPSLLLDTLFETGQWGLDGLKG